MSGFYKTQPDPEFVLCDLGLVTSDQQNVLVNITCQPNATWSSQPTCEGNGLVTNSNKGGGVGGGGYNTGGGGHVRCYPYEKGGGREKF